MLSSTPNSTAGSERTDVTNTSTERARAVAEAEANLVLNLDSEGECNRPASTLEYEILGTML